MHVFVIIFVLLIFHASSAAILKKHYKKVRVPDYKGKCKSLVLTSSAITTPRED